MKRRSLTQYAQYMYTMHSVHCDTYTILQMKFPTQVSLHFFNKTLYTTNCAKDAPRIECQTNVAVAESDVYCIPILFEYFSRSLTASLLTQRIINTRVSKWKCTVQCICVCVCVCMCFVWQIWWRQRYVFAHPIYSQTTKRCVASKD